MSENLSNDNKYSVGTTIYAKAYPGLKLIIKKYYLRIYYCAVVEEPERKQFAYFERELIPPAV